MKFWQTTYMAHPKEHRILWICTILLLGTILTSLCMGAVYLSPWEIWDVLQGNTAGMARRILLYIRLPRTLAALLAGSAVAVSGWMIQTVLDNPLAGPNLIGIHSGAGFFIVLASIVFPAGAQMHSIAAFLGAMLAAWLIYWLGYATCASRLTVILAGVAVSSIFSAGIDGLITLFPDALMASASFKMGGVSGIAMAQLFPQTYGILLALLVVYLLADDMDILRLGDAVAQNLGLATARYRCIFLILASILSGLAVSFAGLIGFIGLVVPHIGRRIVGEESRFLLLFCILGGSTLLLVCDLLARMLFRPYEIPVGLVLSLGGGPFFLWLLLRGRRRYKL